MTDCIIIGYNDVDFGQYVESVRATGVDGGAYRDLNLAFITLDGRPMRSMDVINNYRAQRNQEHRAFSNVDFLWPVITYLYTYLRKRGFEVEYVNLFQRDKDALADKLRSGQVRSVAITTTLYVSVEPLLEIVQFVRLHSHNTKIIVGGPFVSNQTEMSDARTVAAFFKYIGADIYVVSNEGEHTLARVLEALRIDAPLDFIPNLLFVKSGRLIDTGRQTESNTLADNMVLYELFREQEFNGFVSLRTAKSCPFSCSFCGFPQRAGKYNYLPVDLVEKELDAVARVGGIHTVTFIDDTFNVPMKRFKEILQMMVGKSYGFRWNSYLRSDHTDAECIDLMYKSGCEGVFLGVESGSDQMLKAMNKTARRADYLRVISQLKERGIVTHANLIVGFPGENLDTLGETVDFIETAGPDFYRAQLWYCDPTTPVWKRREELQIRGSGFQWSHPSMDSANAAKLVDRLFLDIHNSSWLPQYGFELWSVFYLQRNGMTLAEVKHLVSVFNSAIKYKLQHPESEGVPPQLQSELRSASLKGLEHLPTTVSSEQQLLSTEMHS
jgi:radical SAM PhpK family P-methyltransferase